MVIVTIRDFLSETVLVYLQKTFNTLPYNKGVPNSTIVRLLRGNRALETGHLNSEESLILGSLENQNCFLNVSSGLKSNGMKGNYLKNAN